MAVGHWILAIAGQLRADNGDDADLGGHDVVRCDADRARQPAAARLQTLGDPGVGRGR
jgi:hypothetical protein